MSYEQELADAMGAAIEMNGDDTLTVTVRDGIYGAQKTVRLRGQSGKVRRSYIYYAFRSAVLGLAAEKFSHTTGGLRP